MDTGRTTFQIDILAATAAAGDEPSGADIRRYVMEHSNHWKNAVGSNHLYHTLDALVECGYLAKKVDGRANKYLITEDGLDFLRERHSSLERAIA